MKAYDRAIMEAYEKVAGKTPEIKDDLNYKITDDNYKKEQAAYSKVMIPESKNEDFKKNTLDVIEELLKLESIKECWNSLTNVKMFFEANGYVTAEQYQLIETLKTNLKK